MESENYYKVLNVHPTAELKEIKKAYHVLALRHHPDKNGGNPSAVKAFQTVGGTTNKIQKDTENSLEIATAWETLSDEAKRRAYDVQQQAETPQPSPKPTSPGAAGQPQAPAEPDQRSARLNQQESAVHDISQAILKLGAELHELEKQDVEAEWLARNGSPYFFGWLKRALDEEEKAGLERERLQRAATRRVKLAQLARLERARGRAQQLREEYRREHLAHLQAEAKRRQEERLARARAKAEAARARAQAEAEQLAEELRDEQWLREARRAQREARKAGAAPPCTHRRYWGRQDRSGVCSVCAVFHRKFVLVCPGCEKVACASCVRGLKQG